MKKRLLSALLILCMALTLLPAAALAEEGDSSAVGTETGTTQGEASSAGGAQEGATTQGSDHRYKLTSTSGDTETVKYYITMAEAMKAAQNNDTITLLDNVEDGGIQTASTGKVLTIDFNGKTYTSSGSNPAGSLGSQVCQVLKGNTITMKNGTLVARNGQGSTLKTLIQNYGTLTLEGMTLDGTNLGVGNYSGVGFPSTATFTLNSYNGDVSLTNVTIKNSTSSQTAYSIGCGWWPGTTTKQLYPDGTTITVNGGCSFDNVLVYRDDKNQATGSNGETSNIKVGSTTIKGEWTGDDCYTEYLYKDSGLVPVFTAGTTTLTSGDYILTHDVDLTKGINVTGKVTLDLNGKTIGVSSDSKVNIWEANKNFAMFNVKGSDTDLTIKDTKGGGKITAKEDDSYVVNVLDGGNCTVEGGELTGNISVVQVEKGHLTVTGGTFKIKQLAQTYNDYRYMLNCIDANYKDKSATIEVKGGTFYGFDPGNNLAELNGPVSFLAEGYESAETVTEGSGEAAIKVYTVGRTTPVTAEFGVLDSNNADLTEGKIFEKSVSDLGEFKVSQDGKTVTVTGSAKYISNWTQFNSNEAEQNGHYLPINIALTKDKAKYDNVTITGAKAKVISGITKDDPTIQLVMRLDGIAEKTEGDKDRFTVKYGNDDTYTVVFKDVVLLPQEAEGTTVEASDDNNAIVAKPAVEEGKDGDGTEVVIPKDASDKLGEMIVEVKAEESVTVPEGTNETVSNAITKGNGRKIVRVTVKLDGDEVFTHTSKTKLPTGKTITITIGGLTANTKYSLFCISTAAANKTKAAADTEEESGSTESNKVVTYCGTHTINGKELTFTTNHLCEWVAVPDSDESIAAAAKDAKMDTETGNVTIDTSDTPAPVYPGGGSWGGSATTHAVTVKTAANGKVSVSSASAAEGTTVTLTVTPDAGYELDTLSVTDASGRAVTVSGAGNTRTFVMPGSGVTVSAAFKKAATRLPFSDVASGAWYYDAVAYVYDKGLMNGTANTLFSPDSTTTRGMLVTLLYRLEGQPTAPNPGFTDVSASAWYAKAVAWANINGIVNGYGDGKFGPDDTITREQMAAMLYRYAGYKGYDVSAATSLNSYIDAGSVSGYAGSAVSWAVAEGLVSGVTATSLVPQGSATRAQLATILMRFCESIAK